MVVSLLMPFSLRVKIRNGLSPASVDITLGLSQASTFFATFAIGT